MAINFTFVPTASNKVRNAAEGLQLEDIPQDVKDGVEEIYTVLKTNPGSMRVDFPTRQELDKFVTQVMAYCALRPAGRLVYRKSPVTKNTLPPGSMQFRITDPKPEDPNTGEIRQAVENVKAAK